jgi:hypothetical protein
MVLLPRSGRAKYVAFRFPGQEEATALGRPAYDLLLPGGANLPSSIIERGQKPVQLFDVRAKVVNPAEGLGDLDEGAGRITVELAKTSFEALELRAEDQPARSALLQEPP